MHWQRSSQQLISSLQNTNKTKPKESICAMLSLCFMRFAKNALSDEFVDSFVELFDGVEVVFLDSIDDAGRHVLLKNHAAH